MSARQDKVKLNETWKCDFLSQDLNASQPTILVAEDHDDTREMLSILLTRWGCRVVEASNGLEAVETALRERPALILMDGSLPLLDGLGATRRIRENGFGNQVKILALNGWGSPIYHAAALAAGCDGCIPKPIDFDQLKRHLIPLFVVTSDAPKQMSSGFSG